MKNIKNATITKGIMMVQDNETLFLNIGDKVYIKTTDNYDCYSEKCEFTGVISFIDNTNITLKEVNSLNGFDFEYIIEVKKL